MIRYWRTKGRMGEMPTEYLITKAAKYLGCTPWQLAERPDRERWLRLALEFENAERMFESGTDIKTTKC